LIALDFFMFVPFSFGLIVSIERSRRRGQANNYPRGGRARLQV